jgi:tetratricopeptide (TPR) repeat protein
MKNIFLLFCCAFFIILLWGCTPKGWEYAQKEYAQGNNYEAVKWTASTLREKPNYKDAVVFLSNVLPTIYNDLHQKAKASESRNDWDNAVAWYRQLKSISDIVQSIPPQTDEDTKAVVKFETKDVSSELDNAINKAAELHYNAGVNLENSSRSKEAAKEYTKALEYIPNYKDASERYEKMRTAAIKRVAIMPFENKSGKEQFGAIGENLSDQSISAAMSDSKNMEFLEFVTRDRLYELMSEKQLDDFGQLDEKTASNAGKVLGIHSFVFGKVNTIAINTPPETKTDVQQTATLYDSKTKQNYNVSATVTVTTRKSSATLKCTYQIIDVSKGTIVKSGTVDWTEEAIIKFGRFRGQESALNYEYRNLCSKEEEHPPSEDILVTNAIEKLSRKLATEVAGYFR